MPEQFFGSPDEEYDAASWMTTLRVMQRVAERTPASNSHAISICHDLLKGPEVFYDHIVKISRRPFVERDPLTERGFVDILSAVERDGTIRKGLSDAAALLCADPVAEHVKQETPFARLLPLVKEMVVYCDGKYLASVPQKELGSKEYAERLHATQVEADFYIRQYDDEPETVPISPLYL